MQPFPAQNSVIVLDNCQIHKHPDIQEMIEERYVLFFCLSSLRCPLTYIHRGMQYEFLPPYSPDYNPIELAFLAMKYHLRRNGSYARLAMIDLSDEDIYLTLVSALYAIHPQDIWGWFKHCGYL